MKIIAIVVAHNEEKTLPQVVINLRNQSLPFVAVLDNPTPRVREIMSGAFVTYETEPCQANHVYRWQKILNLIAEAADRQIKADWVFRTDADEFWTGRGQPDMRTVIERAENHGCNVVNFGIRQYAPRVQNYNPLECDPRDSCAVAPPGHVLYMRPFESKYHRAWKPRNGFDTIYYGGHVLVGKGVKPYESEALFDHIPFVDVDTARKKLYRNYTKIEIERKWHIQYKGIRIKDIIMKDKT